MKLDRLILVNWGALHSGEYPMGNMTLLTGPSGAGKSTILDALQTVMTAVYTNIFSYNPSQGETTQTRRDGKTKRTLWSYIVGAEDNLFARPDGAHGYIGAVFKPSEGEQGKEFTALIAASARVDGSGGLRQAVGEKLNLLIIDDAALSVDDLYRIDGDNMWVVEVERIESMLSSKYPKVLNLRDLKREYLCQLYGRFRGMKSVSFQEAEAAAKAWCHAIALPKIDSVDDLVKHQILDFDGQQLNQRISHIAELMQQVHALRKEGDRLQENVRQLTGLEESSAAALQGFEDFALHKLVGARRALVLDQRAIAEASGQLGHAQQELSLQQGKVLTIKQDLEGLQQQIIQVQAQLMGIPAAAQKDALESQLQSARVATQTGLKQLQVALARGQQLQERANQLLAIEFPPEFSKVWDAVPQVASAFWAVRDYPLDRWALQAGRLAEHADLSDGAQVLTLTTQVEALRGAFEPLYTAMTRPADSLAAALSEQRNELAGLLQTLETKEADAAGRKRALAGGGTDYPGQIRRALQCFRAELPGVTVQVLCDLIEPLDEDWQPAIEAYMGDARFNFLVAPEHEEDATNLVKQRQLGTRVVQGAKSLQDARADRVHPESIVHDLQTEHPVAKAYLMAQFGDVIKVRDAKDLKSTRRGVLLDGRAAGSRTTYHARVQDLVFGQAQRRLALERAMEAHNALLDDVAKNRSLLAELVRVQKLVDGLFLPEFDSIPQVVLGGMQEIDRILNSLDQLDLTAIKDLDDQRQSLETERKTQDTALQQANRQVVRLEEILRGLENTIVQRQQGLAARETAIVEQETRVQGVCLHNPALSFLALADKARDMAETQEADQAESLAQAGMQTALSAQGDLREGLSAYNQRAKAGERLDYGYAGGHSQRAEETLSDNYAPLVTLLTGIRDQLRCQRDTGLYKNVAELRQAEQSFRDVFTKQFCFEIRNAVDTGIKTLKALNAELSHLKFGTDRFYLDWSAWVPEFKAYYDFFEAAYTLSEAQESEDLFTTTILTPAHCEVRDRLVHLLLSEDQDKALQELRRIADYRNYRRYEIWKESDSGSKVALSTWGTGSGGQLQTPSYIIQAAVVVNRLKHFEKGPALKLLVNDESFHRMDETRTHDVLKFLRDNLGLQVICAMPTKNAGPFKPEFTKEWCVTRTGVEGNGEVGFVAEADERDLNPDALRELWEHRRDQVRTQAALLFEEANPLPAEA